MRDLPTSIRKLRVRDPELSQAAARLCEDVAAAGGRALLVGGSVRDALLGQDLEDLDFEVFGLAPDQLVSVLEKRFSLDLVGRSFGVLKLKGLDIDVALPRRESKRGLGHRGFEVHSDPDMTFDEAARRRDFTINAMGWDPLSHELLDPANGRSDLAGRVLRHVSHQFSEDPLRVLRGMQFAARFELRAASETVALCRTIDPEDLPPERLFAEWRKLLIRGRRISNGLTFLRDTGWLRHYPELQALVHCPQDRGWHPEGDVWVHTLHVLDAFAETRTGDDEEDLIVGLACLCHDLGKPLTTVFRGGHWRSPGHEHEGETPTRSFLARLTDSRKLVDQVVPLVREHMNPYALWRDQASPAAIRRLARRVGRIDRLVRVCRADHMGRPPLPFDGFPAGRWLLDRAAELDLRDQAPEPVLKGRHLIALGRAPGPGFGPILDAAFEAQLDGAFDTEEEGVHWLERNLKG
ncbi:MAG: HD domain-containing protein [Thermoanaerobaculia bacterium]|nr:HD domain-containing protein [Thermoanaerobaculia bacterium]